MTPVEPPVVERRPVDMSYARMSEKQKILAAEVSELLAEAEKVDKDEDARFGEDNSGYGLPEELARREGRFAKITQAKAALESEARQRAAAEASERARAAGKDEDTIAERAAAAPAGAVPKPQAQRNFTDPDSRIMKTADGSFAQCFNAQAGVDADHHCAADSQSFTPMMEQARRNTGRAPKQALADAGYCSQANLEAAQSSPGRTARSSSSPLVVSATTIRFHPRRAAGSRRTTRSSSGWHASSAPRPARPATPDARRSSSRSSGRSPPCRAKHVLLRGLDNARSEWELLATCHNLRKLHSHLGVNGLGSLRTAT